MSDDLTDLAAGWAEEDGRLYHFEHIALASAKRKAAGLSGLHIVETVNWSIDKTGGNVHLNRSYAFGFTAALATYLTVSFAEVAEDVVAIRKATAAQEEAFWRAYDHFKAHAAPAPRKLTHSGFILSASDGITLQEGWLDLKSRHRMLLYKDGVTDASNADGRSPASSG
jgi:hypothetical protein